MPVSRKLAVIMFTDIKGYTALMGKDEEKALRILRQSREIHKTHIEAFRGKWLKEMGDGVLAQFESAKDAVQSAIAIQKQAHQKLDAFIRIGIHLGDVTIENEDIFGDGVNLASRLQDGADPGGIYISDSVQKAIRALPNIQTRFLGEFHFKNVDYPVRTYAVQGGSLPLPSKEAVKRLSGETSRKFPIVWLMALSMAALSIWYLAFYLSASKAEGVIDSIAVLPFEDRTSNEAIGNFLVGMHEGLNNELSQIKALRVISKTTMKRFQNTQLSVSEIAQQLGVDAIVETSVFQLDSLVRLNLNLIQAFPEEKQLWSKSFSRDFTHVLELYRKVTQNIVEEMKVALQPHEMERLNASERVNAEAMAAYWNARNYWGSLSREGLQKALEYYQLSIEKDPEFAPGYGGIAAVWAGRQQMGFSSREEAAPLIHSHLDKALALDNHLAESYYFSAVVKTWTDWDWSGSEKAFQNALEINPNFSEAHAYYSHLLMCLSRPVEMKLHMDKALELDPYNPLLMVLQAVEFVFSNENEAAIQSLGKLEKLAPNNPLIQIGLWGAYHNSQNWPMAYEKQKRILELVSDSSVVKVFEEIHASLGYMVALEAAADRWAAQYPERFVPADNIFWMFAMAGNKKKALDWLEIGYQTHDSNMPYTAVNIMLTNLREEPQFQDIVERLNLPFKGKLKK